MMSADQILYTAYLEGSLCLSKDGEWFHNGARFQNERLAALFHKSIIWDEVQKRFFLQLGRQRATFTFEDTPYFVTGFLTESAPWHVRFADCSEEVFIGERLSVGARDQFYYQRRDTHSALITRAAHQFLVAYAVDEHTLLIAGKKVKIPPRQTSVESV